MKYTPPVPTNRASAVVETDMIEAIKVLRLRPGDIVVLRTPRNLPQHDIHQMKLQFADWFASTGHAGVSVMVLDGDVDIELMRKAE